MAHNKIIPVQTLSEMISDLGYSWHSPDYYISADQVINLPSSTAPFRPGFYGLILCIEGWLDLTVNDKLVHIGPYNFFAGGPNMIGASLDRENYSLSGSGSLLGLGILGLIFSFVLLWNPGFAGLTLVVWTACALLTAGIYGIFFSFQLKKLS